MITRSGFFGLTGYEIRKYFKPFSTKLIIILCIVFSIINVVGLKGFSIYSSNSNQENKSVSDTMKLQNEKSSLQDDISNIESQLTYIDSSENKDYKDKLEMQKAKDNYYLNNNLSGLNYDIKNNDLYNNPISNVQPQILNVLIIILSVLIASSVLGNEFKEKTLEDVTTKPFSRNEILSAKLLTSLIFCFFLTLLSFIINLIGNIICFSADFLSVNYPVWFNSKLYITSGLALVLFIFLLTLLMNFIFVILSFVLSVILRSKNISVIITVSLLLISFFFKIIKLNFIPWIYFFNCHFTDYLLYGSNFYGFNLLSSIAYSLGWSALLIFISYIVFNKRSIK